MDPSAWRFASHVHATLSGADLVLLDVRRDAYFCLPDVGPDLVLAGSAAALPEAVRAELQAGGLLAPGVATAPDRAALAVADDLFDQPFPRPTARERLDFVTALAAMTVVYRGRPFEHLLRRATARKARGGPRPGADLRRRSLVFRRLLPWSPVQGACLFQAALLLEYLGQAGLSADWVFGVQTWPFRAHCWLQAGPTVLNDTVDRVAGFSPILVA